MTIIAWDGETLAADKRAISSEAISTVTKIFKIQGCLLGYSGTAKTGEALIDWFMSPEQEFPKFEECAWARLLVITKDKEILCYEGCRHPLRFEDKFFAIGSGCHFALAAMYLGKSAIEAIEVASHFDPSCGNGINSLRFE